MALMEALGVATILPLVSTLTESSSEEMQTLNNAVKYLFSLIGVPFELPYLLGLIIITMALKAALMFFAMVQVAHSSAHVIADLRLQLLKAIMSAQWSYYTSIVTGESVNAIGTEAIRSVEVYRQACNVFAYVLLVIVYILLALGIDWKLTLASLLTGAFIILLFKPIIRYGRHYGEKETTLLSESAKNFTEVLISVKPIRAMFKEKNYVDMLQKTVRELAVSQKNKLISTDAIRILSEPIIIIFIAVGLYIAVNYTSLSFPGMIFLAFLFHRIVSRIVSAQRIYQNVVVNESALNSMRKRISDASREKEIKTGTLTPQLQKSINLKNISFSYGEHKVLSNIDLDFTANKFHLIMGGSGAGKTTLIDLIVGLHEPTSGNISIDDINLPEIDIQQWRTMIGYVPQDLILFHDSVYKNITLGDDSITTKNAEDALRQAGAWDFVHNLEDGISTTVGEKGGKLSGGQRQRISIARALVHKPQLLILDEATSSLDQKTEKEIFETIKALSKNVTVIAISHHESAIKYADQTIKLDKGHVTVS